MIRLLIAAAATLLRHAFDDTPLPPCLMLRHCRLIAAYADICYAYLLRHYFASDVTFCMIFFAVIAD